MNEKNRFICPQCKIEVQWLGAEHLIEPFWNRLPKFFSYPISIQTLIVITALSLSSLIFTGPGLFNLLIGYLIWGLLIKYSYEALKATAQGNLKPPRINAQTISEDFHQVFKQLVLFFLIGFVFAWLSPRLGIFASGVFLIVVVLSVPAMIILLVTTNSLMHALNPLIFTRLIIRIGWGYVLMFFFLALLGGAPAYLSSFIGDFMPVGLHQFLFAFAQNFYTVISYHLMGYVILQYHQQIGYQVGPEYFEHDSQTDRAMPIDDDARTLKEVKLLVQTGRLDKAISFIKEATKENGIQNIILSERYYNLHHEVISQVKTYLGHI
ncbi:MAG: hypothetical protein PVI77_07165 [Desulfobacterales bacterium]